MVGSTCTAPVHIDLHGDISWSFICIYTVLLLLMLWNADRKYKYGYNIPAGDAIVAVQFQEHTQKLVGT